MRATLLTLAALWAARRLLRAWYEHRASAAMGGAYRGFHDTFWAVHGASDG